MSLPRITPRPLRVIKIEYDPYDSEHRHSCFPFIGRYVYEDGICTLFAGSTPVRSIRCDHRHSSDVADNLLANVVLEFEEGYAPIRLYNVRPEEEAWLNESIRRFPQ